MLAISDDGLMVTARLLRDAAGRPTGVADGQLRRMQLADGRVLGRKWDSDTESLDIRATADGPQAAVSFEGHPQVRMATVQPDGFLGPLGKPLPLPGATQRLRQSKGLESIAFLPDGRLLILAERAEYKADTDDQPGWLIGGGAPVAFRVHRSDDYDLTDAKVGPDGRLYVLERLYSIGAGIRCRIRRFDLAQIKPGAVPGAVLDGPTLFEANLSHQIDNMEGLSLWQAADGRTRLSLISDDNHSILERTLYLEFELAP